MSQVNQGRTCMVQGRIVWVAGDLFKGKVKTEFNSNIPRRNAAGEVQHEYGFGLAVPKSIIGQPGTGDFWVAMHEEAYTLFPNRVIPPAFAMKYKDGDGVDDKGVSFAQREGYAGHVVLACTTSLPIKFFRFENGQNILVNEGIKCGDYVNVQLHIKAHPAQGQGKAGLYLNPNAVQFLGYGKEIVNTPSGDAIFGNQMPAMPAGASAVPLAPQGGLLVPTQAAPAVPMPAAPVAPAPAPITPHYGVVPPSFQPPAGGMAAPTPVASYPPMPAAPAQVYPPQVPGMPPVPR